MAERGDTTDSISFLRPHHVSLVLSLGLGLSLSRGGPSQRSLAQQLGALLLSQTTRVKSCSVVCWLCDIRQIAQASCASVLSSVKVDVTSYDCYHELSVWHSGRILQVF